MMNVKRWFVRYIVLRIRLSLVFFFFSSSDSRLVLLVVALAIARVPAIFVYYFAGTVN
jgi:hypothetical protein